MRNQVITPHIKKHKVLSKLQEKTYYSHYPALHLGAFNSDQENVVTEILGGKVKRHREKYLKATQAIIFNLHTNSLARNKISSEESVGLHITRTKSHYSNQSRYAVKDISYQPMISLLNGLENKGRIRVLKGFKSKGQATGIPSTIELTEGGLAWLQELVDTCSLMEIDPDKELIYLGDENTKNIEYEDTEKTNQFRQQLKSFNNFIAQHSLIYTSADDQEEMQPHSLFLKYHRKFHKDFSHGGRLYSPIQNLKKEERRTIKLDGQPTVELDFKSLHLRLLYNMSGLKSPEDCYEFGDIQRKIAKKIALVCLNCKSQSGALQALHKELRNEMSYKDIKQAVDIFLKAHRPLSQYFFRETWAQLHYWDSTIAFNVMRTFQEDNVPIIGVHDSFVVPEKEEDRLYMVMTSRYRELAQFEPVIS
ncbi:hypothetical protein H0A36_26545, partial [Endozoicomonas sp. SM1973]